MIDMTEFTAPKSDQINADDFLVSPATFTISGVKISRGAEQPVSLTLDDMEKVYRPCKSMRKVMVAAWGADASNYVGRSMTLYCDPKVKWGGAEIGGIRISHMSHISAPKTMALTESKANRKPFTVRVLEAPATPRAPLVLDAAEAMRIAEVAASLGSAHFKAWYNTDEGKDCRATGALTPAAMLRIKGMCEAADEATDPFGLPSPSPRPDDAALEAAHAAAMEAAQANAAEHDA